MNREKKIFCLLWVFFLGRLLFAEGVLLTGNALSTVDVFTKGSGALFYQPANLSAPLPIDDEFLIGTLDNGLTYYIREATNPRGRAEFFIVHNVGSLQEEDDQRGLAHFLEHMAFNGTKNFPGKSLLEYFGSIGVKFGANINAYTSMDRTVYNISDVPVDRSSVVDSALLALHDWSHYITCDAEEIEKERGVVREEWRRGDVSATRMMKAISRFQQTGSRFAERDVIGLPSVIDTFERQTLIDYYYRWYRPDLQAVIVVGDIDKKEMEQRVIRTFSTIPAVKDAPVRQTYGVPDNKEPIVGYFTDPETSAISTRITIKIPPLTHEEKQSGLYLYDDLLDKVFLEMIRNRFRVAATYPDSPFRVVIPVFTTISYANKLFTSTAIPVEDEESYEALQGVAVELERAKQHGFVEEELAEAKKNVAADLEKSYQRFKNRKNVDYVNDAVEHYTRGTPLIDFDLQHTLRMEMLNQLPLSDIHSRLDILLNDENRVVIFSVPERLAHSLPTESQVLSMMDEVRETEQEPFAFMGAKELEPIPIAASGNIIQSRSVNSANYGITHEVPLDSTTEWTLENGVTVVWKEEFGKRRDVQVEAFRPGGYAYPGELNQHRLLNTFLRYLTVGGLSYNELTGWGSRNRLSLRPFMNRRSEGFSGSFTPLSSEPFFTLLHAFFTNVSVDEKELEHVKGQLLKRIANPSANTLYNDSVNLLMYRDNRFVEGFSESLLSSITPREMEQLYQSHFYNPRGFTIIFSGPMRTEEAKPLVEKYIASITAQDEEPELTYIDSPFTTGELEYRYQAPDVVSSKATVTQLHHEACDYNAGNYLLSRFTAYILSSRYLKSIREDKGGTYHVGVSGELDRYPFPTASIKIEFDTDPALVDELLEVVQKEIDELVAEGPTEQEVREIKLYLEKRFADRKKNVSWMAILSSALKGEPNLELEQMELLEQVSARKVHAFAKRLFESGNRMIFVFEPQVSEP